MINFSEFHFILCLLLIINFFRCTYRCFFKVNLILFLFETILLFNIYLFVQICLHCSHILVLQKKKSKKITIRFWRQQQKGVQCASKTIEINWLNDLAHMLFLYLSLGTYIMSITTSHLAPIHPTSSSSLFQMMKKKMPWNHYFINTIFIRLPIIIIIRINFTQECLSCVVFCSNEQFIQLINDFFFTFVRLLIEKRTQKEKISKFVSHFQIKLKFIGILFYVWKTMESDKIKNKK